MAPPLLEVLFSYLLLVVLFLVAALAIYGYHPILRWRFRHIPGPPVRWLVGILPDIATHNLHHRYAEWDDKYGEHGVFKVFWGTVPIVVVTKPELIRRVFRTTVRKFKIPIITTNKYDSQMLENHMLFVNNPKWKEMRNVWTPFFSQRKLEGYLPRMSKAVDDLLVMLDAAAEDQRVMNIWPAIGLLTFDVIATAAAGIPIETMKKEMPMSGGGGEKKEPALEEKKATLSFAEKLALALRAAIKSAAMSRAMGLLYIAPGTSFIASWLAKHSSNDVLVKGIAARTMLFETYLELLEQCRKQQQGVPFEHPVDPESFLAAVALVRDKMTGELKPPIWPIMQAHLFLMAGFETTASAVTYTLYLLACNPDKEEKLLQEIDTFGRTRVPKSSAELEELPYLKAALLESLRIMPPAPMSMREAKEDMQLGPYFLPKGTKIHGFIYGVHRNEKYWEKALEYIPERFLPGAPETEMANEDAFMPFGDGARRCPGYKLAIQEAMLTLLRLYQNYTFKLMPGQEPLELNAVITLSPAEGVYVTVQKRNGGNM